MRESLKRAQKKYHENALKRVALRFSRHDATPYQALLFLEKHYGSKAAAIKQALIAHAESLKSE